MSENNPPTAPEAATSPEPLPYSQLKIATFNLFNYLEPPDAFYDFVNIYSLEQWHKKQRWIGAYLREYQPDIIGFQEVFSPDPLQTLVAEQGYAHFRVVDQPEVIDGFIYRSPVVAIASRFPIVAVEAPQADSTLAQAMGLKAGFSFSRKIIRATIDLPHIGHCDCYVVHFKSKRPLFEHQADNALSTSKNAVELLKTQVAGGWGSAIQRGSEAALLLVGMIARREACGLPMMLLGDFNTRLSDGVLSHLLSDGLRPGSGSEYGKMTDQYVLKDAWDLFLAAGNHGGSAVRKPTHYYGAGGMVLDYILLSREFDGAFDGSLFAVSGYESCDRHLINPCFARDDQSTDHAIVSVTLTLRH